MLYELLEQDRNIAKNTTTDIAINEAYYGKNDKLVECEKIFQNVINEVNKMPNKAVKITDSINKEFIKMSKVIQDLFNFKECIIVPDVSFDVNAFYLPDYAKLDYLVKDVLRTHELVETKEGLKYDDGNCKTTVVYFGLGFISLCGFTAQECVAITLHELGHALFSDASNISLCAKVSYFYMALHDFKLNYNIFKNADKYAASAPFKWFEKGGQYGTAGSVEQMWTKTKSVAKMLDAVSPFGDDQMAKALKKNGNITKIRTAINNALGTFNRIMQTGIGLNPIFMAGLNMFMMTKMTIQKITHLIKNLTNIPMTAINTALSMVSYNNEKFADMFASAYGYGQYTISAHAKVETGNVMYAQYIAEGTKNKMNIYILDLLKTYNGMILTPLDCHPTTINRIKSQIKYLKNEASKTEDPRVKKLILKDLQHSEDQYDNMIKKINTPEFRDNKPFTALYMTAIEHIVGLKANLPGFNFDVQIKDNIKKE